MRTTALALAALLLLAAPAQAAGDGWLTDFEKAKAQAKQEGKLILADFTGSDWCVYCKKLDKEVFGTAEFKAWAKEKVVLLELDYPARKKQPAPLKAQNKKLEKLFKIDGYPTVVFMDAEGKELARSGYRPGGPTPWIAHAERLLSKPRPSAPVESRLGWTTDYDAALARAKQEGKLVLAEFTGSDWCSPCKKLKAEVFETSEFKEWAQANVVLLELDFPRSKPQPEKLKEQNRTLRDAHGVKGYPTVLLLDASGNSVGKLGYLRGGPAPWIERAQGFIDAAK